MENIKIVARGITFDDVLLVPAKSDFVPSQADTRTQFSEKRTHLAGTRTVFSNMRTGLARGRTHLALIRTGLAFLSLSVAFFRMFGLSWWSIFGGALGIGSLVMTMFGLIGYMKSARAVKSLENLLPSD